MTSRYSICGVVFALLAAGCGPAPEEDRLATAERMCLDQQWREAISVLKAHLLEHPDDPGAHFYLGRCYFNSGSDYLYSAGGEFETALTFFVKNGRKNTIERFPDDFFELICHIEGAKVPLKVADVLMSRGAPYWEIEPFLDACENKLEQARAVDPDHKDVTDLQRLLDELRQALRSVHKPAFPRVQPTGSIII
ncbi:MAG TPA: hypothetical protein HPP77_00470 [Candidatus Hydrogenedentes bacterium]|nr:hypothetical protein [Candidatus Hydrogenedentota bacterium]